MAYATHYRITFEGTIGGAEPDGDIFSFGICTSATLQQAPANAAANVAAAGVAFFADSNSRICSNAVLRQVKVALKNTSGHNAAVPEVVYVNQAGGSPATAAYPFQIARVISLNAATATKRAKGRFYLPSPYGTTDGATGHTSSGLPDLLTSVNTLLDSIETAMGESVVVASGIDGNHVVTQIRVGNVLDTMRSRRNKLRESYTTLAHS